MTQCSVPRSSYFTMCSGKSEHNCLTSYWHNAAILARFLLFACLRRCFSLNLSNRNKKNGNQQKTRLEASKPPTVFTTALIMVVTLGQQLNVGENPPVILYTYINRHAGTSFTVLSIRSTLVIYINYYSTVYLTFVTAGGVRNRTASGSGIYMVILG